MGIKIPPPIKLPIVTGSRLLNSILPKETVGSSNAAKGK